MALASAHLHSWTSVPSAPLNTDKPRVSSKLHSSRTATGLWILSDIATIGILAILSIYLRRNTSIFQPWHPTALADQWPFFLYLGGFAIVLVVISRARGLYGPLQSLGGLREQSLTVESCILSGLILSGALYFTYAQSISRAVVIATMVSSTVLLCIRRAIWRIYMYGQYDRERGTRNVLIVGVGHSGFALKNHLSRVRHLGYTFKGYVSADKEPIHNAPAPRPWRPLMPAPSDVLGNTGDIETLVRKHFIDELFITGHCGRLIVEEMIAVGSRLGIDVRVVPELYDGIAPKLPIEYVGQIPTFPLHFHHIRTTSLMIKRLLDIAISLFALLFTVPLMSLIALAIRLDSPGPIFYCAERIGRKGSVFRCWKFRTMVTNADAMQSSLLHMNERDGILFKVTSDPRITRVGRFLRKYSLDELPQFFNVLCGTMSIVGPRPPVLREVSQYKLHHLRRLDVSPGITGLWQVEARQDPSFDQYISLDTYYVDHWSLWLDIKIMIRTFAVVLGGTGS